MTTVIFSPPKRRSVVNFRTLRLALRHPDLVVDFLRGASLRELDTKVHMSPYWPSEFRHVIFGEIDRVKKLYEQSNAAQLPLNEFMEKLVVPNSLKHSENRLGEVAHIVIYLLIRRMRPQVLIETGVQGGITTSVILRALHENGFGKLHSIDLPNAEYVTETGREIKDYMISADGKSLKLSPSEIGNAVPAELRYRWNLTLGDARLTLGPLLSRLQQVDFFFHDSEHTYQHMMWEYKTAWPHIRNGGILAVHDIDWNASFDDFQRETDSRSWKFPGFGVIVR